MRLVALAVVVGAVLAPLAAEVWVVLSDPPTVRLAANGGLYLGEQDLDRQAGATLWFLAVGALFGLVAGACLAWFGRSAGPGVVVAVLVLCGVATVLSRYLGTAVLGPDTAVEVAGQPGTGIRLSVDVGSWVAYLGWPVGGLTGAVLAILCWRPPDGSDAAVSYPGPTARTGDESGQDGERP